MHGWLPFIDIEFASGNVLNGLHVFNDWNPASSYL